MVLDWVDTLDSLAGLDRLEEIGGFLRILECGSLSDARALRNVVSIGEQQPSTGAYASVFGWPHIYTE